MLKALAKGLLGHLLAYAVLVLGFWLLYQGLLRSNIPLGILGGVMILWGMYLMVAVRRIAVSAPTTDSTNDNDKEDSPGDSLHRGS
jgi:xanthine/uracil permease